MNKDKQYIILEEMKATVGGIREDMKNGNELGFKVLNERFLTMAYVMEVATGNEYHWSCNEDKTEWAVVIFKDGKERRYSI